MQQGHEAVDHAFIVSAQTLEVGQFVVVTVVVAAILHGLLVGGEGEIELVELDEGVRQPLGWSAPHRQGVEGFGKGFAGGLILADPQVQRAEVDLGHALVLALFQAGLDDVLGLIVILELQQGVEVHLIDGGVLLPEVVEVEPGLFERTGVVVIRGEFEVTLRFARTHGEQARGDGHPMPVCALGLHGWAGMVVNARAVESARAMTASRPVVPRWRKSRAMSISSSRCPAMRSSSSAALFR